MAGNNEVLDPSRESARQDLQDIYALKQSEPFNRYFLRRLRQRHEETLKKLKYDKMSYEEREACRLNVVFIEGIVNVLAQDEATARKELEAP